MIPLINPLRQLVTVAALGLASVLSLHSVAFAQVSSNSTVQTDASSEPKNPNRHWVATWGTSPQTQELFIGPMPVPPTFSSQTLRQIVHTSVGGNRVRVRLSNTFGTTELVVGAARVGLSGAAAQVVPGTNKALTFSGRSFVTIPAGALVVSDPVVLEVPNLGDLSISVYLPNPTAGTTVHNSAFQTNYVLNGDVTDSTNPTVGSTFQSWYFLTNVEVYTPKAVGAIVCLGDSITDGTGSTPNLNHRWPNFLAQRIIAQPGKKNDMAVIDQGIGGNRLLHSIIGPNALSRFDRDVIAQTGVTDVILLEGINDIGFSNSRPAEAVSAADVIAAYRQLIIRAHEAGLRIFAGTLTPFAVTTVNSILPNYYTAEREATRQVVNNFIRNSGEFDGVIDFEAAIRDNQNPPHMLPQYDSGDHLHPSDAGYEAMANAVDLNLLQN